MTATFCLTFAVTVAMSVAFLGAGARRGARVGQAEAARIDMAWSAIPLAFLLCLGAFLLSHG